MEAERGGEMLALSVSQFPSRLIRYHESQMAKGKGATWRKQRRHSLSLPSIDGIEKGKESDVREWKEVSGRLPLGKEEWNHAHHNTKTRRVV